MAKTSAVSSNLAEIDYNIANAPDEIAQAISNVTMHPGTDRAYHLRVAEALLFASAEPLGPEDIAQCLPDGTDIEAIIEEIAANYADRGVNLVCVNNKWTFRTADDLSFLLRREAVEQKKLSKAALETLSIIAYHQPATRAEIEEIRGVSVSRGTIDILLNIGWIRLKGRRRVPGKPVTYGTTDKFLEHFGLASIKDLPGLEELKGAGLLSSRVPSDFSIPLPDDGDLLGPDELPFEEEDEAEEPLEMYLPDYLEPKRK